MTIKLNPVTRGDLRSRLASPKLLWVLRLYVAVLSLLAVLSLPPEVGRLSQFVEADLVQAFLLFQLGWVAYLTSALAVGEIGVEGEKAVLDLAATSFSPVTIALGKLWTSMLTSGGLVLLALPPLVLLAPFTIGSIPGIALAILAMVVLVAPLAIISTWLAAAVASDLLRPVLHWSVLLGLFAATRWLGDPFVLVNPMRVVAAAYRGAPHAWPLALLPYLAIAALGCVLTGRAVVGWRREVALR